MCYYTLFSDALLEKKTSPSFRRTEKLFREILEGRRLELLLTVPLNERSIHLTEVIQKFGGGPLADKTTTKLLTNGDQTFSEILRAIEQAKHHIHIQYYIYKSDEIGTKFEML